MNTAARKLSFLVAGVVAALCAGARLDAADNRPRAPSGDVLVLLGTAGGPGGRPDRAGIATLVTVDGRNYLIDAGAGVEGQLAKAGVPESAVPVVFLTHLHDDHTAGLVGLMSFAYTTRARAMEIIGPPRTRDLVDAAVGVLKISAEIRRAENPALEPPEKIFRARDVTPGLIYSEDNVRVRAVENAHYHFTAGSVTRNRSYALRFETPGRVIVFTGDTGPSMAVTNFARGADVLVAEMVSAEDRAGVPSEIRRHMEEEHLSPAELGKMAHTAGVKLLVISHVRKVAEADLAEIRSVYKGRIVVGHDLDKY